MSGESIDAKNAKAQLITTVRAHREFPVFFSKYKKGPFAVDQAEMHIDLGKHYSTDAEWEEAEVEFLKGLKIGSIDTDLITDAHTSLGLVYHRMYLVDEAEVSLRTALAVADASSRFRRPTASALLLLVLADKSDFQEFHMEYNSAVACWRVELARIFEVWENFALADFIRKAPMLSERGDIESAEESLRAFELCKTINEEDAEEGLRAFELCKTINEEDLYDMEDNDADLPR
jgi:tetratricopeptide (TPR) repeat protein